MTFLSGLIVGALIGGVIAIFVYRKNKRVISKYADQVDNLVKELDSKKKPLNRF